MSQINAPIHSYKRPQTCCQVPVSEKPKLGNIFYLANETRYINSDLDSERPKFEFEYRFSFFNHNEYFRNECFSTPCIILELKNFNFV